jgi:branched-chain amino acid transport system permease protein
MKVAPAVTELVQQILNGLSLGSIYALIALGYTMVYGILRLINFAHGEVFMVGAYAGLYVAEWFGIEGFEARGQSFPLVYAVLILCAAMAAAAPRWPRPRCSAPRSSCSRTARFGPHRG